MAKLFTLQLVNPDVKNPPVNVIDTGLKDGNKLNLILTNNFGFDLSFSGDAGQPPLLVKFTKNIIDDKNFGLITVASPWTTDGFYTPDQDPDTQDNKDYFVLKLKPPSGGVAFKDGASITIGLETLDPIAKGNATVFANYDFDGITTMNAASQLAVLGANKPGGLPLIGGDNALLFNLMVNDGGATNPIIVTKSPVTHANATENKIHLNFDFQDHNMPPPNGKIPTLGNLVPGWDAANPPTFRIQFPYFSADSQFPAIFDLTDDIKPGEQGYNDCTSAWNIKLSLSRDDPSITSNLWWTITLDPLSTTPSWLVQPTAANKYLFTGRTSGPAGSGLFLDLFFSHIYSALEIDTSRPETLIYLETYNFPGFNDSFSQQPLFKEQSVQINCFEGEVKFKGGSAQLILNWDTNAGQCFVSGDTQTQGPNTSGGAYQRNIQSNPPLRSSYTLTAIGKDGISKLQRTIYLQWKEESNLTSSSFTNPTAIEVSPDGTSVYVAGSTKDSPNTALLSVLDGKTLVNSPTTVSLPNGTAVMNVKASSDGSKLFLAGLPFSGDSGYVFGYTTAVTPTQLQGSPAEPGFNSSVNLYPMAVSQQVDQVVVSAPFTNEVPPFLAGYNVSDFKPSNGSPYTFPDRSGGNQLGPIGLAISGNNIFYPTHAGLGVIDRTTFKPVAGSPISLKSDDNVSYTPGPLAISPDGTTVTTLAQGYINNKRVFILCKVDINSASLIKRIQVYNGYSNSWPTPTTSLIYSPDGKYLFVFGINYTKSDPDPSISPTTLFSVFDADSLQELSWSPVLVTKFYVNMVMAPDGSRIYVITLDSSSGESGSVLELVPYFTSDAKKG